MNDLEVVADRTAGDQAVDRRARGRFASPGAAIQADGLLEDPLSRGGSTIGTSRWARGRGKVDFASKAPEDFLDRGGQEKTSSQRWAGIPREGLYKKLKRLGIE